MAGLEVHLFTCLSDNYGVLIHDAASGATASIDAPEPEPVLAALKKTGWTLSHILVTHKHADHTQGIPAVKEATGCMVVGPANESEPIKGVDRTVSGGDSFDFAGHLARILPTPGHTQGHITWWFEADRLAFVGDTLFVMGCGRVFDGAFDEMWASLDSLRKLPVDTRLYCGHEYTQANARFALSVEPGNAALQTRAKGIDALRADKRPTIPTSIILERETNPFLRPESPEIQERLGMKGRPPAEVFAELRRRKDNF